MNMPTRINPARPFEELRGVNAAIVSMRLGNCHCMMPLRDQLRLARPKTFKGVPPALRRGWVKYVCDEVKTLREMFGYVNGGIA
jgi:hypothetical protein